MGAGVDAVYPVHSFLPLLEWIVLVAWFLSSRMAFVHDSMRKGFFEQELNCMAGVLQN